jgi:hypothetical protein
MIAFIISDGRIGIRRGMEMEVHRGIIGMAIRGIKILARIRDMEIRGMVVNRVDNRGMVLKDMAISL